MQDGIDRAMPMSRARTEVRPVPSHRAISEWLTRSTLIGKTSAVSRFDEASEGQEVGFSLALGMGWAVHSTCSSCGFWVALSVDDALLLS